MEQNRKVLALEWLERAEDDELNILSVLKHRDGTPAFVCFASQQVVEKCLKALLLFYSGDYPKEHSLSKLTSLLEVYCPGISEKIKSEIVSLDPYYIGTRYPGDIPLESFTWKLSEEAYKSAVEIKNFVLEKINKNQKGFIAPLVLAIAIAIVVVLGITGFAAYKYFAPKQQTNTETSPTPIAAINSPTPTLDETDSWKTYRNDDYGFEIQYPNDWPAPTWEQTNYGGGISFIFNKKIIITYYKNDSDLPNNTEKNLNLDEWLSDPQNYYFNSANFNHLENVTIGNNYPATKTYKSYCNGVPLLTNEYFTLRGAGSIYQEHGDIYQIEGPIFDCLGQTNETQQNNYSSEYEKYEKILNQMVSTFKFTK